MKSSELNSLLNSFFITEAELNSRVVYKEFVHSVSSLVMDEFFKNYLLNNPYLSIYLAHTDGSMLLKKIKNFFSFVLTAPIDEKYIETIHNIGFIHHSIRVEPAKVSYAFWAVGEVINKISATNPLISEHKSFITKLLRFVEHVMNDGYYIREKKKQADSTSEFQAINAQNELYIGLNTHKQNAKKVELAIKENNINILNEIEQDSEKCSFGKMLEAFKENKEFEYILGTSSKDVNDLHSQWHNEFSNLKNALQNKDDEKLQKFYDNLLNLTNKLSNLLETSLENSLRDGELSLRSGMKSIKKITSLFYNKDHIQAQKSSQEEVIKNAVEKTIQNDFSWAIQEMLFSTDSLENENSGLIKTFRYKAKSITVSIVLKTGLDTSYLDEMLSLLLDILELHFYIQERELSLIAFADEAESANKSKDVFLANMSHELRTPINAITGFSQILMMKKDTPEDVKKYVEKINVAGNNLLGLVNTILDFAKLESGKMQFNPSLSNIANILNEVKTLITPLAKKKDIELTIPNIVSLNLFIDGTLFKQVLINLFTNAIKFTHEKGKVSLSVTYNEDTHTYNFAIKDNGVGLSKEEMAKLFKAFSQVENTYQKEHKGTGLGLMISKSIIEELHKGKIWVESIKGSGSTFFIEMPTPIIESHTFEINKAPQGSPRTLIVEDSSEYQKILTENLEDTHHLTITDTVNKAKILIQENHYDFLILDFFLTDGISSEILYFMEQENISIPSIVVSAEDEIHISTSLSGSSNLQCILNKKDVDFICASLRGEKIESMSLK